MQTRVLNGISGIYTILNFKVVFLYFFVVLHRSMLLFYTVDIRFRFETNSPSHRLSRTTKKRSKQILHRL